MVAWCENRKQIARPLLIDQLEPLRKEALLLCLRVDRTEALNSRQRNAVKPAFVPENVRSTITSSHSRQDLLH